MKARTSLAEITPYLTKDGSEIRELLHPGRDPVLAQSLAEAVVPVASQTRLHRHRQSEEIYHVTRGRGRMTLGNECFDIAAGDSIVIAPGIAHRLENTGDQPLHVLCCCAPAYSHDDTELL